MGTTGLWNGELSMAVYMKEEDRAKIPSIVNIKGQGYKVYSETREERALKKTARKENREIKKAPKLEKKKEIAKSRKEMEERRSFADVAAGRNQSKDEQDEEGMSKTGTEEESEEEKEPAQEEARRENVAPSLVGLEDGEIREENPAAAEVGSQNEPTLEAAGASGSEKEGGAVTAPMDVDKAGAIKRPAPESPPKAEATGTAHMANEKTTKKTDKSNRNANGSATTPTTPTTTQKPGLIQGQSGRRS